MIVSKHDAIAFGGLKMYIQIVYGHQDRVRRPLCSHSHRAKERKKMGGGEGRGLEAEVRGESSTFRIYCTARGGSTRTVKLKGKLL